MLVFGRFYPPLLGLDTALIAVVFAWALAYLARTLRSREVGRLPATLVGVVGVGFIAFSWWNEVEAWRPFLLGSLLLAPALAALRPLWRKGWPSIATAMLAGFVLLDYGSYALLSNLPPFGMTREITLRSGSPNGRYDAVIINRDGIAYGFDELALRPRNLDVTTLLDRPQKVVAEFVMEQVVTGLRWDSPTQLTVRLRPKADVMWKHTVWNGITIRYEVDPTAESASG